MVTLEINGWLTAAVLGSAKTQLNQITLKQIPGQLECCWLTIYEIQLLIVVHVNCDKFWC